MQEDKQKTSRQADYKVGYGRPPQSHRFKPGQSGNPKGRPKGSRNSSFGATGQKRINALILDLANKDVTLKENGHPIKIATVQAILIAIYTSALKGKVGAQRLSMDLIKTAEYLTEKERLDFLETLISYKFEWEKEFRRCDKGGFPRPNILPHPDDIVLDFRNGDAWIDGPLTHQHRDRVKAMKKQIADFEDSIIENLKVKDRHPEFASDIDNQIAFERQMIEKLEKALPSWHKRHD